MLPPLSCAVANALGAVEAAFELAAASTEVVVAEAAEPAVAELRAESPRAE